MERVLVIGAHYDDAELGVAGTSAKLVSLGKEVFKLTLTDNVTKSEHLNLDIPYHSSKKESAIACDILGVTEVNFQPIPCCELVYTKEIMQNIESFIFSNKIDTCFIHYEDDYNQDHVQANIISKTASRHCKRVLAYQSNGYCLAKPFYPSFFIDISSFASKKIQALKCYEHQHNRFDRLFEMTMKKNEVWGYSNKVDFAEGFVPIKFIY